MWEKARVGWFERKHWNMYITTCKIDDQSKFDAWNRELKAGSGITQRDGLGKEVGAGFRMQGHMYTHGWFMSMCGKNHHSIAK